MFFESQDIEILLRVVQAYKKLPCIATVSGFRPFHRQLSLNIDIKRLLTKFVINCR
jgi:hypothetical protein